MTAKRGMRIGIAVGADEVVAVVRGQRGAPTARVAFPLLDEGPGGLADVRTAVQELKDALQAAGAGSTIAAEVDVALLPPLADVRVISFPPMRRAEVEAVLGRDVGRHFLGANRPRVVGVRLPAKGAEARSAAGASAMSVVAAAAPTALLEALRPALEDVGWSVRSFSAAQGGWIAASGEVGGTRSMAVGAAVALVGGTAHVLRLEGSDVAGVRQLPAQDHAAVAAALGGEPGRVLVLASPPGFEALERPLAAQGWAAARDPDGWSSVEESSAARAGSGGLELVPPSLALRRRERRGRRIRALVLASAVLLVAAAGARLWGAHRELASLEARRAEIQSRVMPLIAERDSLSELTARAESMEALSETTPIWTRALVELTALLPEDAYLTAFYASGDTVEIEAAGARAGETIQALREAGLFEEVKLQGLVERELQEGETVVERFRLWARLPAGKSEEASS